MAAVAVALTRHQAPEAPLAVARGCPWRQVVCAVLVFAAVVVALTRQAAEPACPHRQVRAEVVVAAVAAAMILAVGLAEGPRGGSAAAAARRASAAASAPEAEAEEAEELPRPRLRRRAPLQQQQTAIAPGTQSV